MNDRDFKRLAIAIGLGFLGLAIVNMVYRAGFAAGVAQDGPGTGLAPHVGFGFFPFPPLLFLGIAALLFVAWRSRRFGDGPGSPGGGPGGGRPPRLFEEWHRRAHEAVSQPAPPAPQDDRPDGNGTETRMV